jgi:5-(carboxyamino)imidazole ribonucleotide mutase
MSEKSFSVGILMGSKNDWELMKGAAEALDEFGVSYNVRVISAHRSPGLLQTWLQGLKSAGTQAVICGAGGAAHLAGVVAGHVTLPVIGVPIPSGALQGLDALLATVQMPKGIPVATVAIGGSYNAGLLAVQILAGSQKELGQKLTAHKEAMQAKVEATTLSLQDENTSL